MPRSDTHRLLAGDLAPLDLSGADLRHRDLRGVDIRGARLTRADLRGARLDLNRLLEIWIPAHLSLDIVNQIRAHDFLYGARRQVAPPLDEPLPSPYETSTLCSILHEWGTRTWNGGAGWAAPGVIWTLEEIAAAVLDELGCRHDLRSPARKRPLRPIEHGERNGA